MAEIAILETERLKNRERAGQFVADGDLKRLFLRQDLCRISIQQEIDRLASALETGKMALAELEQLVSAKSKTIGELIQAKDFGK